MKKLLLTLLVLSSSLLAFSQGTWSPRDTLPNDSAMFQGIPGFSIGNYGYAGLGDYVNHTFDELWRFDASNNTWAKKAPFPGSARIAPACFVIGDNAYLVCGSKTNGGVCVNECWEYNSTTDTWTQKANFPGGVRTYAVGFTIDSLGYVGTGAQELTHFYKDFYAYHPSTNTWTRIADFGGIARDGDCGFAVHGKGYVCFGQDSTIHYHKDIWGYDPIANSWTQKTDFLGSALLSPSGFVICDNIYVGSGVDTTDFWNPEIWKYNTLTDTWLQMASVPSIGRIQGAAFSIGDTGYYGFGIDYTAKTHNIFDKFYAGDSCAISTAVSETSIELGVNIYPNPFNEECLIEITNVPDDEPIVSLYDINGKKAQANIIRLGNSNYAIRRNGLQQGVYILSIQFKNQVIHKKLLIIN